MMGPMQSFTYAGVAEGNGEEGYSLYFPDLAGCVTAGETLTELSAMAREALQLHLGGMLAHGLALPTPTPPESLGRDPEIDEAGILLVTTTVGDTEADVVIDLPTALLARVDHAAQERGVTRSTLLRESAEAFLKAG